MMRVNKDIKIYQAVIEAKNKKRPVSDVMKEFGISRTAVYDAVKRIKDGDQSAIRRELVKARNEILWEYQFKKQFMVTPKNKRKGTVEEIVDLIKRMSKAGFPETLIAKKLKINRSTVRHHLGK